jgi:hypothetical protein
MPTTRWPASLAARNGTSTCTWRGWRLRTDDSEQQAGSAGAHEEADLIGGVELVPGLEIEDDDAQAVEAFGAVNGAEGNSATGGDEAVVQGDTTDAGAAGQGGSFQGAAPREDGHLFGPTPTLPEPMAQEAVDSGEFLSRLNAFFQHVRARGEWDDLVQAGDKVGGRGGIELFKIGQDRTGVTDGSVELNADRIEPGVARSCAGSKAPLRNDGLCAAS